MTDDQINALIEKTLAFEGGYVNDPDDPGGETKFGISRKSFPDLDIANLTKEQAIQIYREKYWGPATRLVYPASPEIQWKLFDIAVHSGVGGAKAIVKLACDKFHPSTDLEMRLALALAQQSHYAKLIKARPHLVKYLSGWTTRAMEIG